jgi:hypothetical protein
MHRSSQRRSHWKRTEPTCAAAAPRSCPALGTLGNFCPIWSRAPAPALGRRKPTGGCWTPGSCRSQMRRNTLMRMTPTGRTAGAMPFEGVQQAGCREPSTLWSRTALAIIQSCVGCGALENCGVTSVCRTSLHIIMLSFAGARVTFFCELKA